MKVFNRVVVALILPFCAPWTFEGEKVRRAWWASACAVAAIPLTAILHHSLFFKHTCMLNPFGSDYTPDVTWKWLTHDPSWVCALAIEVLVFFIGRRAAWVKILVAPLFSAFLPLSLWIWDIPFSDRFICRHFHDGYLTLTGGNPITTKYFYALGVVLYLIFLAILMTRGAKTAEPGSTVG